ncbi:MAG: ABC transporter substrate-binding protein [Schwartzia sp.]|nr:ABC transporter substrate-binding protein [Schwartzia sp. (in: firmicutes)]
MKRVLWVVCAFLLAAALAGCGGGQKQEKPAEAPKDTKAFAVIKDDLGREVTLTKKPERIVVTSASFLEPLHAVGGDVVGRPDSKSPMPEFAKNKTSIGRVYNVDLEKVLACSPDLVIVNSGMNEKLVPSFEMNGIPAIVLDMKNYEEVKREVEVFSQVTGEKERGKEVVKAMEDRINAVISRVPKDKRRMVILHSTSQGLTVQLETSIAGSVAKMLGFVNVAAGMTAMEKRPDAAPYSIETLVEQNPEIIFITSMGKMDEVKASMEQTMASNPAWQTIPAVKDGRVYYLSQERFLLSPGLHYPEAVEEMAGLIYPEAVKK